MSDTVQLLETIGQNATLRHASAQELAGTLEQANASDAFKAAVASGDTSSLAEEFGREPLHVTHVTLGPAHEEDAPEQDDDSADDHKGGDDQESSAKPGQG